MKNWKGKDLIKAGFEPCKEFNDWIVLANKLAKAGKSDWDIIDAIQSRIDVAAHAEAKRISNQLQLQNPDDIPLTFNMDEGTNEYEIANVKAVKLAMNELMSVPTVTKAVVMPDACPAGFIPVGAVAVTENAIHPGFHSADICCSMFLTEINKQVDASKILDAVQEVSHFGVGGRNDYPLPKTNYIMHLAAGNKILNTNEMLNALQFHYATQGDGNHFFFVGRKESNGRTTIVTHHGSRKPGALLYKYGMKIAEEYRLKLSPNTPKAAAWIPYDTEEGRDYWEALQIIREWTKKNHNVIHTEVLKKVGLDNCISDQFWNEHNFVFKDAQNTFYHAKGATPSASTATDTDVHGRTIVPLNMGEPILIIKNHKDNGFGFAPHGAGRNYSRTQYKKMNNHKTTEQMMDEQVGHIDARFYIGKPDVSELPGAYKNAEEIQKQIEKYKLATVVDRIMPLGSMMAGDIEPLWLKKKKAKK